MIQIPDCSIRKCTAAVKDGKDGAYARGQLDLRGYLTKELAEQLKIDGALDAHLPAFEIERDRLVEFGEGDQSHSLKLLAREDGHTMLNLPAVSLHKVSCSRDDSGALRLHFSVAFDSRYGRAVNEFVWDTPGWSGDIAIHPTQESLRFDPAGEDENDDPDDA